MLFTTLESSDPLQELSSPPLAKAWPRRCTKTVQGAPKGSHSCPKTAKATPIITKSDLKWSWNDLSIPGEHFPGVELRSEAIGDSHLAWGSNIWKVFRWYVRKSTIGSSCQSHIQVFEKVLPANWMYFRLVSIYGAILPISPI